MDKKNTEIEELDQLRRNYLKMDEVGREKLKEVSVKILGIHETVTKGEEEKK